MKFDRNYANSLVRKICHPPNTQNFEIFQNPCPPLHTNKKISLISFKNYTLSKYELGGRMRWRERYGISWKRGNFLLFTLKLWTLPNGIRGNYIVNIQIFRTRRICSIISSYIEKKWKKYFREHINETRLNFFLQACGIRKLTNVLRCNS